MPSPIERDGARLLIVDDKPQNLRLISDFLAEQGFALMLTRSGEQALEKVRLATPDLILLDVNMPNMNGFEVCRRLKAEPASAATPVIFMTALDDTEHKVEGFRIGAVDYITKPIQREELLARIRHHLQLHRLQRELLAQREDLAFKNAELEAYAHTIAHSLQTPLAAGNRFLEILDKFKSVGLSDEQRELVKQARAALEMTGEVVDALLLLSTLAQQNVELQPVDMSAVLTQVLRQLAELKQRTQAELRLPDKWPRAFGYAPWVAEVWLNLISNAFKYGGSPPRVEVGGEQHGSRARFWVRDNGQVLSAQQRDRIFIPFTRLHRERAAGHGLGLATVHRIVSKLGGEVGVREGRDGGNEFFFELPTVARQ
jgi:DNA-binding response OmpR family regulator